MQARNERNAESNGVLGTNVTMRVIPGLLSRRRIQRHIQDPNRNLHRIRQNRQQNRQNRRIQNQNRQIQQNQNQNLQIRQNQNQNQNQNRQIRQNRNQNQNQNRQIRQNQNQNLQIWQNQNQNRIQQPPSPPPSQQIQHSIIHDLPNLIEGQDFNTIFQKTPQYLSSIGGDIISGFI